MEHRVSRDKAKVDLMTIVKRDEKTRDKQHGFCSNLGVKKGGFYTESVAPIVSLLKGVVVEPITP